MQHHERRCRTNMFSVAIIWVSISTLFPQLHWPFILVFVFCISNPTNHELSKQLMSILTWEKPFLYWLCISCPYRAWDASLWKNYQHQETHFSNKSAIPIWGDVLAFKVSGSDMFTESKVNGYLNSITVVWMGVFKEAILRWHFHE